MALDVYYKEDVARIVKSIHKSICGATEFVRSNVPLESDSEIVMLVKAKAR